MNAQSTVRAISQGRGGIGRLGGERIEGRAAVGVVELDRAGSDGEGYFDHPVDARAPAVIQGVGEKLFQHQVQVEFHVPRQAMLYAETGGFSGQAIQLFEVPVEQ